MIGMGLLVSTLVGGFTGYSLVFEQLSPIEGTTVASNIADAVPLVGSLPAHAACGDTTTIPMHAVAAFVIHAALMPTLMVVGASHRDGSAA